MIRDLATLHLALTELRLRSLRLLGDILAWWAEYSDDYDAAAKAQRNLPPRR